jgi:tryptophan 2,3-dioxygenase
VPKTDGRTPDESRGIVQLPDMMPNASELRVEGSYVESKKDPQQPEILYYWDYLRLDDILNSQHPKSAERGNAVHDEYFFIATHQTYELWFKQMLVELDSIMAIFSEEVVSESELSIAVARLERLNSIQKLLVHQIEVLETMTPLDFLDFRSLLLPASGFQSIQFRLIENKFGLRQSDRLSVQGHHYADTLRDDHAELVKRSEVAPSLFDQVERWLARNPFVRTKDFDFVSTYQQIVRAKHNATRLALADDPKQLAGFESNIRKFDSLFDPELWNEEVLAGTRRFSFDAFMGALLIFLYRDQPTFQTPNRFLVALMDTDEALTIWRHRHALLAHRMLGRLTGTAGSGYDYLNETAGRYAPFKDLFDVATYLIPSSSLPDLPLR